MPSRPGRELLHPLPLAAAAVLALNDHVLKGSGLLPGWLTGKLSDVAGLFVFPVLLFAALDALSLGRAGRADWRTRTAILVGALSAALFSAVKLSPRVNAMIAAPLGPMRLDATDLIALPASAFAAWWLLQRREHPAHDQRRLRTLAFMAVATACLATSSPRLIRNYPAWEIESLGARTLDCARVDVWVSKSGKQGFGVTLELLPRETCRIAVTSARFSAGSEQYSASPLPAPLELSRKGHLYLPFPFDNEALWNDGVFEGRLELLLDVGDARERLVFPMRHVWTGPHKIREPDAPPSPLLLQRPDASSDSGPRFAEPPPEASP